MAKKPRKRDRLGVRKREEKEKPKVKPPKLKPPKIKPPRQPQAKPPRKPPGRIRRVVYSAPRLGKLEKVLHPAQVNKRLEPKKPEKKAKRKIGKDGKPILTEEELVNEIFRAIEGGKELHLHDLQSRYDVTEKKFNAVLGQIGLGGETADAEDSIEKIVKTLQSGEKLVKGGEIVTSLDLLAGILQKQKKVDVDFASMLFKVKPEIVESWGRMLEKTGYGKLVFPVNVFRHPYILKGKKIERKPYEPLPKDRKLISAYMIVADQVPTKINIYDVKQMLEPLYQMNIPKIGPITDASLDHFVERIAERVEIKQEHISDPNLMVSLKRKFAQTVEKEIETQLPNLDPKVGTVLSGFLLHKAFGLGDLELLMADSNLEEITINGAHTPITVYHRKYGWCRTNILPKSEQEVYNYAAQIGRKVGRQITSLEPVMDAHLLTGDRVNATLFPISSMGNTITIRKFVRNPWTIINFIDPKNNTISSDIAALLWMCMQYELNVLVAGGTASGKTALLNCLCALIPPNQRIITIEDTRELYLPKFLKWNWVPLTTRNRNAEGLGEVKMIDLMVSSLRMRPDRVILGEIRRREEAEVLFEAMHTGHSVYSTMHAESTEQVHRRLTEPPISIPESEIEALHMVLTQFRDRRTGLRRTYEIAEVISGGYDEGLRFNVMFKWSPRNDTFDKISDSQRVFNDLNLHTGMTAREIVDDLHKKRDILEWMLENNLSTVDQVGDVMRFYYKDPAEVEKVVAKKGSPDKVL